jgi:OOP family OmpA-OmpF porin
MQSVKTLRLLSLTIGALLATSALAADYRDDTYFYGGIGLGEARAKIDIDRINNMFTPAAIATDIDERSFAYKLFGGYQFNRYLALEGGYFDLGKFGFASTTVPAGTLHGEIKLRGINFDVVGTVPLSERWSALARVGAQYAEARDSFVGTGAVVVREPNPSERQTNYKFGLGIQVEFNPSILMRAEIERYRINDGLNNHGDIDTAMVSLLFPIGRSPEPRSVAAVAYVAPPPPPAPEPVVAPPPPPPVVVAPPPRRRVSFSADSLFTFDQASIRPAGKADLDKFAAELKGARFNVITVEGHTDRLGSNAYNQKLSVQRAETVKAYLITSSGVDGTKISAVGKGETAPVTKPEDCKGDKRNPKLIACLQPDRRVEVEVVGSQAVNELP